MVAWTWEVSRPEQCAWRVSPLEEVSSNAEFRANEKRRRGQLVFVEVKSPAYGEHLCWLRFTARHQRGSRFPSSRPQTGLPGRQITPASPTGQRAGQQRVFQEAAGGFRFRAPAPKLGADLAPFLTPGSPSAQPSLALVSRAQGGLTLGPEQGELEADFCSLGLVSGMLRWNALG